MTRTEVGQVLRDALAALPAEPRDKLNQFIAAIEAEAVETERDRIRAALGPFPDTYLKQAVLAIVDGG